MIDSEIKNCTTIFLLPGIGHHRQQLLQYSFLGAYLDDISHEVHHENSVYVLFKPEDLTKFQDFLDNEYKTSSLILEDYDYRGGFVVVVYHFPENYMPEYQLFLQGKYSKFSEDYIKLFPTEIMVHNNGLRYRKHSLQYHIFNRTDEMRRYWERKIGQALPEDTEIWSAPDMDKEVLDITLFQK